MTFSQRMTPILITSFLASALTLIIVVVANLALPSMQQEFDLTPTQLQWIVTSFMLPLGALIVTGGALGGSLWAQARSQLVKCHLSPEVLASKEPVIKIAAAAG